MSTHTNKLIHMGKVTNHQSKMLCRSCSQYPQFSGSQSQETGYEKVKLHANLSQLSTIVTEHLLVTGHHEILDLVMDSCCLATDRSISVCRMLTGGGSVTRFVGDICSSNWARLLHYKVP